MLRCLLFLTTRRPIIFCSCRCVCVQFFTCISWNGVLANGPFRYQVNAIKYTLIGSENGHFYNSKQSTTTTTIGKKSPRKKTHWKQRLVEWTIKWPLKRVSVLNLRQQFSLSDKFFFSVSLVWRFQSYATFEWRFFRLHFGSMCFYMHIRTCRVLVHVRTIITL